MEENTKKSELTYEQLTEIANQLSRDNHTLRQQMQEMNYFNLFKRLDYLFKVVENDTKFAADFVETCKNEIVNLMTAVEEPTETPATEAE